MSKKRKRKKINLTDQLKEEIIKEIKTYLSPIGKEKDQLLESISFNNEDRGGSIFVSIGENTFNFLFSKDYNNSKFKIKETNAVIYKDKLYEPIEYEENKDIIIEDIKKTLKNKIDKCCKTASDYKNLNLNNFKVEDVVINKDKTITAKIVFKSKVFRNYVTPDIQLSKISDDKDFIKQMKFMLEKDYFANKIVGSNLVQDTIKKSLDTLEFFRLNVKENKVEVSSDIVKTLLSLNIDSEEYLVADIADKDLANKLSIIEDFDKNVNMHQKPDDECNYQCYINFVKKDRKNLKISVYYSGYYRNEHVTANRNVELTKDVLDGNVDLKKKADDIVKEITDEVNIQKEALDNAVKGVQKVKDKKIFKDNPLLLMVVLKFIRSNKSCSKTSLTKFLKGNKLDKHFKKPAGYGAFKDLKENQVEHLLSILEEYEILYYTTYVKYGNYCVSYRINKRVLSELDGLMAVSKDAEKDSREWNYNFINNVEVLTENDLPILVNVLNDKTLLICMKKKLRKIINNSSSDIKEFVNTMVSVETDKKLKASIIDILDTNKKGLK